MLTEHLHKIMELIKAMVEKFRSKDEAFALCKRELQALRKVDIDNRADITNLEAEALILQAESKTLADDIKALEDEQAEAMKLIDDITKYLQKQ
ncbi:hypothetical protein CL634_03560 [bacterium]|nr:hypothetical protein [bacterium]|tara:strand:- start:449 stop:730 length:282 start_codon:yes stop_codon:yes gene_type:complete